MRKWLAALTLLLCYLTINPPFVSAASLKGVYDTSWLKQTTLKYGLITSLCMYQSFNGLTEGYHFRQEETYIINGGNYHAFTTAQRISGLTTGWLAYANWRDADLSKTGKIRRFLGSACYGRNAFEWSYKGARYGNPFDYSTERNRNSIVYFGFRGGKLTDLYLGTGPVSGPLVDAAFLIVGFLLMK